jgi:hypothetical protein
VIGQSRQTAAAAGRQTTQPAGLGGVPVIIVRGYIPVPDRVTFTAAELAARLAELGESEAAATATAIARGAPLDLGEHGAAYGWEGYAGTDMPGPLADLAAACERHAADLGLGSMDHLGGGLDPEAVAITVTSAGPEPDPPDACLRAPDPATATAAHRRSRQAQAGRARELATAFSLAGYRAAPGDRHGVELHPDDAARLLTVLTAQAGREASRAELPEPGI